VNPVLHSCAMRDGSRLKEYHMDASLITLTGLFTAVALIAVMALRVAILALRILGDITGGKPKGRKGQRSLMTALWDGIQVSDILWRIIASRSLRILWQGGTNAGN
jgi:hypothetical protein